MEHIYITPVEGKTYRNANGSQYLCLKAEEVKERPWETKALFRRIPDGWTLVAHGIQMYEPDGTIEWHYSTNGHWSTS